MCDGSRCVDEVGVWWKYVFGGRRCVVGKVCAAEEAGVQGGGSPLSLINKL